MPRHIYLASSWRNDYYPTVLAALREDGHDVYDFREANSAFHWRDIDPDWEQWRAEPGRFVDALGTTIARGAYENDILALHRASTVVMVLPCGKSAHLEMGYACASFLKDTAILLDSGEPELMYRMVDFLTPSLDDLRAWLKKERN